MTDDEIIQIIFAHKEGKEIQSRPKNSSFPWNDTLCPTWNFRSFDFRVKPKERVPRDIWINEYSQGFEDGEIHSSRAFADEKCVAPRIGCVHFREVLEDES